MKLLHTWKKVAKHYFDNGLKTIKRDKGEIDFNACRKQTRSMLEKKYVNNHMQSTWTFQTAGGYGRKIT